MVRRKCDWLICAAIFAASGTCSGAGAATSERTRDAWVARLLELRGHKVAAFRVGPELVKLDPDFALQVVQTAWPKIEDYQVKRGLLKAFHFGKPLRPKKHPHVLRILHLGVMDGNGKVKGTALHYVTEYSLQEFAGDTEDYRTWYEASRDQPIEQVVHASMLRQRSVVEAKLAQAVSAFKKGDLRLVRELGEEMGRAKDPLAVPALIGIIDADNSYNTIYGVGYFALGRLTGVRYSPSHDGAWWRRWWQANKGRFPEDVQRAPIPDLPKTEHGKQHKPFPKELDTLDGKLKLLVKQLEEGRTRGLDNIAEEIAEHKDPRAIPVLIGVIDADNSYDTIYGVGYFGLGRITGVKYSPFHDGAWWRRWWEKNRGRYPEEVRKIPVPDLPKTDAGRKHRPFPEDLDTLDGKIAWILKGGREGETKHLNWFTTAKMIASHKDPKAIPYLIGVIDADNTYDTIYGVGYFGLGRLTGVKYSRFHDGSWWRRWWQKNKTRYPEEVRQIPIPDLPKTEAGKKHKPFPADLDTLDGKIAWLLKQFRDGDTGRLSNTAKEIGKHEDPRAIPHLIGVIDADNSYDTIYGVGYFGLGQITDVKYSPFHDGAWWRRWWETNGARHPEEVRQIPIPNLPKTEAGKKHKPFPTDLDTLDGKLSFLRTLLGRDHSRSHLCNLIEEIEEAKDPRAIPSLIALADASRASDTVHQSANSALRKLTGVPRSAAHDADWWRKWWEENKSRYSPAARNAPTPDYRSLMAGWKARVEAHKKKAALADVAGIPVMDIKMGGQEKMRYLLVGPRKGGKPPPAGYSLVVVLPGGHGGAAFNPFVRRLYKHAMGDSFLVAQPVAFKWQASQRIVWPTRVNPTEGQQFSTEEFVEAVIQDVKQRQRINERCVLTLSWSSGGPAAYAISLQEQTAVKGSYILMSVYRHEWLPPVERAKGHVYLIEHSPEDKICPFGHARQAERELREAGATVRLVTYSGGHGWHGDMYSRVRRGVDWLVKQMQRADTDPEVP